MVRVGQAVTAPFRVCCSVSRVPSFLETGRCDRDGLALYAPAIFFDASCEVSVDAFFVCLTILVARAPDHGRRLDGLFWTGVAMGGLV